MPLYAIVHKFGLHNFNPPQKMQRREKGGREGRKGGEVNFGGEDCGVGMGDSAK